MLCAALFYPATMESEGRGEGGYGNQDHPPGLRFVPTDQDLLGFYLHRKKATTAQGQGAGIPLPPAIDAAIPTLDLFVPDAPPPWLLHPAASTSSLLLLDDGGDKGLFACSIAPRDITEWFYCFSRTTPRGSGSARATKVGTWQTTIGERKVQDQRGTTLGYKSTLAFKVPSAGGGGTRWVATDWVMHEFKKHAGRGRKRAATAKRNNSSSDRGESSSSPPDDDDDDAAAEEWVLCRIRCTKHTVTGPPREDEEEREKGGGFGMQGRQEVLPQPADYCADDQVAVDVTGRGQKRRRTSEGPLPESPGTSGGGGDSEFGCFLQAEGYPVISSSGMSTPEQPTVGVEQEEDGSGQLVPAEGDAWGTVSLEQMRIMFSPAVFFSPSDKVQPGAGTVGGDMDFDDGQGWFPSPWAMEVAAAMGVDIGSPCLNAPPVLFDDVPVPEVVVAPLEPAAAAAASHGTGGRSLEEVEGGSSTGTNISRGNGIMAAEHESSSGMITEEEEDDAWWDAIAVDGSCCIKNAAIQDGAQVGHHMNAYSWELLMAEDTLGPPEYAYAAGGAAGSEALEGACMW